MKQTKKYFYVNIILNTVNVIKKNVLLPMNFEFDRKDLKKQQLFFCFI